MNIDYNSIFWGDSTLERITIEQDIVKIVIFNDVLQRDISCYCTDCIGISQVLTWDEVIIENVFINNINVDDVSHPMLDIFVLS